MGLQRCGKSCRLRWTNYIRPDLKCGDFTGNEEQIIVNLHAVVGNRWSLIAAQLPGRTDNDVKNYWKTKLKKMLSGMGIDPVTHKPFSHLMAEIATILAPPQVAHLAEAALGCFKDEILHLLTKKTVDFTTITSLSESGPASYAPMYSDNKEETIKKINLGLSQAMHEPITGNRHDSCPSKPCAMLSSHGEPSDGLISACSNYTAVMDGFDHFDSSSYLNNSAAPTWNQSLCNEVTMRPTISCQRVIDDDNNDGEEARGKLWRKDGEEIFESDCGLWDLADDLMIQ